MRCSRGAATVTVGVVVLALGAGRLLVGADGSAPASISGTPLALVDDVSSPSAPTTVRAAPVGALASHPAKLSDGPGPVAVVAPVRIRLERLDVDAAIAPVGVDSAGDVVVPSDPSQIGWYRFGAAPGSAGSSVLVGHVDYDGVEGSFFRLGAARAGDVIDVVLGDGSNRRFSVTDRGQYPKSSLPTSALFRQDVAPRLVLVSCGGAFQPAQHSYSDNIVVVATPI